MKTGWIIEDQGNRKGLWVNESIFNVANGYLGVRGNYEEGYDGKEPTIRGTYINAFYDITPIQYGESAYAFPDTQQKLVNVIDVQDLHIRIGEESFSLFAGQVVSYRRWLNMKEGKYVRLVHWISPQGKELEIEFTRMASFTTLELFVMDVKITRINCDDEVTITSGMNGDISNYTNSNDPRVASDHAKLLHVVHTGVQDTCLQIVAETSRSRLRVAATTFHELTPCIEGRLIQTDTNLTKEYVFPKGKEVLRLTKYNVFTDTRRHEQPELCGLEIVKSVVSKGIKQIWKEQELYLEAFWAMANIEIQGDAPLQEGLRYNVYQLLQSVGKDKYSNIAAKGLSGEGYEGHYFWDTEIYILPFFILCQPELAKQLLRYRYTILGEAKIRAKELGHRKGAAYAWRTITGQECSAYFPAGTAQFHINGDIAYTYIQYYLATGDEAFIAEFGAEVVFETARTWIELGHFDDGVFKIDAVTGPDEYTAIVNNNYYTNVLAKYNMEWAVKWYRQLKSTHPEAWASLCNRIELTDEEIIIFEQAAAQMYLPFNDKLGIHEQDDSFLSKKVWDFENTPRANYPLLLNYHPLFIYRHQVLKQADTVLAHFLIEDGVSSDVLKSSYDYYEKITTHDSSLSSAIYSIMASKIGYADKAYSYFIETARMDLDNTHGNTKDGLHMANMGGTWMAVVYGFTGVRIKEDQLVLNPVLPKAWEGYKFSMQYRQAQITVEVNTNETVLMVDAVKPIVLEVKGKRFKIQTGKIRIAI
ncbi:family 65 glycosyl hydrolase [Paenibacillus selenitireducens]|uniref:Family 65 glycosyl hydrolase n=1 Tax=Paenibacillus selenitireducens TaxID=1324314 RepID=A0A1T2X0H0_9BACL|nr:glycosyl hydrolase family 65 protein [Paenibacillus selenitireducens]OPA73367.1 family 65 glycosyl hydrolase [Paenibacillus selenitireducens]